MIDGTAHTVIGVLPADFRFMQRPAEIVLPMQPNRARSWIGILGENAIARLKPGVSLAVANADVERMIPIALPRSLHCPEQTEDESAARRRGRLKDTFVRDLGDVLGVMTGTIALLLLIACANVANLQLVRTDRRARELAIRAAVGAGWRRIAGSVLVESVVLALVGGAAGLALAAAALPPCSCFSAPNLPTVLRISIDPRVVAFAIALSLGVGRSVRVRPGREVRGAAAGSRAGRGGPLVGRLATSVSAYAAPSSSHKSRSRSCCSSGRGS